jgi:hypothetical protein
MNFGKYAGNAGSALKVQRHALESFDAKDINHPLQEYAYY